MKKMGKKTKKECSTKSTCTVECFSHIPPTYDTQIGGLAHRTREDTVRHGYGADMQGYEEDSSDTTA